MTAPVTHIDLPAGAPLRIGIDLGTSNTVAATGGQALELLGSALGAACVPSVVAYPPTGKTLVGEQARERRLIDPRNTIYSSKRVLGRRWESTEAREYRARYPFEFKRGPEDEVLFVTRQGPRSAVQVAATLLERVRAALPADPSQFTCAVTVPTSFGEAQRRATEQAAADAGLGKVKVVDEPHAAAWAYQRELRSGLAAVYDLGGGTFNFSLLDCSRTPFSLLVSDGDPYLGGDDIDFALAGWAVEQVLERYHVDIRTDREAHARLVAACERGKISLSRTANAVVSLADVDPALLPVDAELKLDLPLVARLTGDLLRRTFVVCEDALRRAGVRPRDVDTIVMSGGSSHLPLIQSGLQHFFGKAPRAEISPSHVVAIGASISAMNDP